MLDAKVIEAFKLMWGNFPEPVILAHKTREIMAVNKACAKIGRAAGMNCAKIGSPEDHQGCRGNEALATGQAAVAKANVGGKEMLAYWLPLDGYPEYFVHFAVVPDNIK
ncbi:MAG: hypothetical protein LBR56_08410 [Sporomusaceae bacterium]|jgi:hypothetical protein|nr:hypothetical protein [Sporomusaceae bacterium]